MQVSRLGNPLMNELHRPDEPARTSWNRLQPRRGRAVQPVPHRADPGAGDQQLYGLQIPTTGRTDLLAIFHSGSAEPERVRLERGHASAEPDDPAGGEPEPAHGGAAHADNAGWPNGRRLVDDVIDLAENGLEGAFFTPQYWPVVLGDGVNGNDKPYQSAFPYVALPHQGFTNSHGDLQPTTP